ncbi:uncharacterized protein F4807DRAFT_413315 [Annulohypoxylon truncatum]|uniref:uncharacterized protein n=1 Tax=Annulohypoxylon truncatum TaxID=327061 RepID=UPI002007E6DD|nr:uncharacterized protein F4807DRAFT_413315 [Annulohypoxylon truncatum]KAI1212508.1 hypothetical protein F4807DRAFT_413315 [Annulohypoxylon truncatum]
MAKLTSLFQISIWLLAGQVSCGSIAAWWNTRGPSFIMQDDDTGGIRYSLCNSNSTPIFPDDKTLAAPFYNYIPKNKTSLAASGWTDSETAWASIFYLDNNDEIINALLKCDWNTGHWQNTGEYITSGGSPKVSPTSALSVVLLGSMDGYRVYYNDLEGSLHQIGYTTATSWAYYGLVSNDKTSAQAIGSTFSKKNITVMRPRDDNNIGVSRLFSDNLWHLSTFPEPLAGSNATNATQAANLTVSSSAANFSLPAWNGSASALAVSIDDAYTRSVFYIGTDRNIHQISNKDYAWSVSDPPSDTAAAAAWPQADVAGGPIGIANAFGADVLRLYYVSGGRVVEANGDGGTWAAAAALPSYNASQASSSSSSSSNSTGSADGGDDGNGGLSDGAKVGISVGVTLGVIAVAGMGVALWFLRYRQRKIDERKAKEAAGEGPALGPGAVGPGSAYGGPSDKTVSSHDGYAAGTQGYPGQNVNAYGQQVQGGYAQQPGAGGYAVGAGAEGYGYPQQVHPGVGQDGAWAYGAPVGDYNAQQQQQQQQYYYQQQQHPQELAEPERPVELMGEGHYKEVP